MYVLATMMAGFGEAKISQFMLFMGNTAIPSSTQFYSIQLRIIEALCDLEKFCAHEALLATIAGTPNARTHGIPAEFDGRWPNRRQARQAFQIMMSAIVIAGFCGHPIIASFTCLLYTSPSPRD